MTANGTQKGDVYSFGIIAQEVVYRRGPFYIPNSSLKARGASEPPHSTAFKCIRLLQRILLSCHGDDAELFSGGFDKLESLDTVFFILLKAFISKTNLNSDFC